MSMYGKLFVSVTEQFAVHVYLRFILFDKISLTQRQKQNANSPRYFLRGLDHY